MSALGLPCSLFSFEDFENNEFRAKPALPTESDVIYRSWMMTPDVYVQLVEAVAAKGAHLITQADAYRECHYLPGWYSLCVEWTPETIFADKDADFLKLVQGGAMARLLRKRLRQIANHTAWVCRRIT